MEISCTHPPKTHDGNGFLVFSEKSIALQESHYFFHSKCGFYYSTENLCRFSQLFLGKEGTQTSMPESRVIVKKLNHSCRRTASAAAAHVFQTDCRLNCPFISYFTWHTTNKSCPQDLTHLPVVCHGK